MLASNTSSRSSWVVRCFPMVVAVVVMGFLETNPSSAFSVGPLGLLAPRQQGRTPSSTTATSRRTFAVSASANEEGGDDDTETGEKEQEPEPTDEAKVGNLVENDEWEGLTMELSEVIRMAVTEDIKKNTKDFLGGKDEYKVGDITKEIDKRVKSEIATMRGKDEYEMGDLIVVVDNLVRLPTGRRSM